MYLLFIYVGDCVINMKTIPQKESHKPELSIAVLTPYLYMSVAEFCVDKDEFAIQVGKYLYDPDNLHSVRYLETDKYILRLDNPVKNNLEKPEDAHLVIAGCAIETEFQVSFMKYSGALVARYSIFHGGPSQYTGFAPEVAGYAFDVPKEISTIRALLADDQFLEAILEREESKIVRAIESLNQGFGTPIIVTPYLSKALQVVHTRK